jgi:membrane protein DedA with SNARE-associated domain
VLLASVSSSFTSQVAHHGVYAVFGLLALGALLPVGSELVALVGGAVAAGVLAGADGVSVFGLHLGSGAGAYVAIALAATFGYLLGCLIGWVIGRWGGRELLERHGRWFHVTPERLDRADAWFEKWDRPGVLIGTLLPVVRSFVALPAGIFEMPLLQFLGLALIGSAIWSFAFVGIGYGLGASYNSFEHGFRYAEYAIVAGIVLGLAYLVYRRLTAAKVAPRADDSTR